MGQIGGGCVTVFTYIGIYVVLGALTAAGIALIDRLRGFPPMKTEEWFGVGTIWPFMVLVVVGFLGSEVCRWLARQFKGGS